jgi:predicted small metal-binding protein
MKYSVSCRDVGIDCDYNLEGNTEEELFKKAEEHGRSKHGFPGLDEETKTKIRSKMRQVA